MAVDVNLVLDTDRTVIADGNSDYIEVEGGFLAWVAIRTGAMSGASTTCDIRCQVSPDAGVTYYMAGKAQQLGPSDDDSFVRFPVYIPRPEVATNKVRVRLNYDVAGSSPSYVIEHAVLEPMTSLGVPAIDEELAADTNNVKKAGAAAQIAAV